MKVIILAAGYAVRLRPLTLHTPKPLLKIGGRAIIDRIIDRISAVPGCDAIYVVTNARFYDKFEAWRRAAKHADRITVINDGSTDNETRLGAIKDIEFVMAAHSIDDDLLVVAGDNLFDLDLARFVEFARSKPGVSIALYDVGDLELAKSYGIVRIDAEHRVVDFEEKPERPKSTLSSTGIYFFPKNKLSFIKKYVTMQNKLDAPGYYIGWLSRADSVYGHKFLEDWYDIGTIESYKKADEKYTKKERRKDG